jgi:hypothetical protein
VAGGALELFAPVDAALEWLELALRAPSLLEAALSALVAATLSTLLWLSVRSAHVKDSMDEWPTNRPRCSMLRCSGVFGVLLPLDELLELLRECGRMGGSSALDAVSDCRRE